MAFLRQVRDAALALGVDPARLTVDPTLARGLDYYTGPVFEAVVKEPNVGSIAGGGRYDGLVGVFSKHDIPAVGVSLGLERIITVMKELGMLPEPEPVAEALVTVFGPEQTVASLQTAATLRAEGVRTELYSGDARFKNQFKHANARGYRWLVVIGPDEADAGTVMLKDLVSGTQENLTATAAAQSILSAR